MNFIELFCGIGGFRLGLEACNRKQQENAEASRREGSISIEGKQSNQSKKWGNYTCVYANDIDKYACQVYRKRFGAEELYEGDIRAVDTSTISEHDLLCAGFPCQSFSIAGQRGGFTDIRGTLFQEICRILGAKRTPYLFLENVKGLLSAPYTETIQTWDEADFDENGEPTTAAKKKHKPISGTKGWVFLTILNSLWELGYDCQWQVLNSKNFGVSQNRERVFIIGHLRGRSRPKVFPIGETNEVYTKADGQVSHAIDSNYHKEWLDNQQRSMVFVRGVMGDKNQMWLEDGKEYSRNFPQGQRVYSPAGISAQLNAQAGGWGAKTGLYEIPLIRTRSNRNYKEKEISLPLRQSDKAEVRIAQALQTDGQLRSGTSWNTDKPQSARNIRRLTPTECERLQAFPDGWTEEGLNTNGNGVKISDSQRYKTLGNAVTVNVIEAIGKQLLPEITEKG